LRDANLKKRRVLDHGARAIELEDRDTSKHILREIRPGERQAIGSPRRCSWHQMASDGRPRRKLKRKQEEAIAALLSQRNVEEAARSAGVGTRTLIRWMKIQGFDAEYRAARQI